MSYDYVRDPAPESDNRFALRLRMLRSAAGMTPEAVAAAAGIGVVQYRDYESGRTVVTAAALMRLTPALGVSAALFFDPN